MKKQRRNEWKENEEKKEKEKKKWGKRKKNKNVMPYIQQSLHFWFRKPKRKKLQSFNYSEKKLIDDNLPDYNSILLFTSFMRINKEAPMRGCTVVYILKV